MYAAATTIQTNMTISVLIVEYFADIRLDTPTWGHIWNAGLSQCSWRVHEDTVSEQGEHDEVDGRPHAVLHAALRADPVVHHFVPVLPSQNLQANAQK